MVEVGIAGGRNRRGSVRGDYLEGKGTYTPGVEQGDGKCVVIKHLVGFTACHVLLAICYSLSCGWSVTLL
jgi:hypothetical protein